MSCPMPHFVLVSSADRGTENQTGRWSFRLEQEDGSPQLKASETEPRVRGERLALLAVVRGLEALDEPSAVTLFTDSNYVHRGLTEGLDEWRANGWTWEAFGDMVPVKNRDLWQRVDRAMTYHRVDCRRAGRGRMDRGIPAPHFRLPSSPDRTAERTSVKTGETGRNLSFSRRLGRLLTRLVGHLHWQTVGCGSC